MPIRILLVTLMRIRIRIRIKILRLIKVMQICNHWSILSPHPSLVSVHDPPWLNFEPLKLMKFDLNADPDPDPVMWIQIRIQ